MMTQSPAAGQRPRRAARLAFAALLVAGLPVSGQDRSHARPHDSGSPGRTAHESGSHASAPSSSHRDGSSTSSREPRTAHPTDSGGSEPHRQPPSRSGRGSHGGHGGNNGHGGYYGGGWYGGGYYSYPYGFWPRFWWGVLWDDYPYYYPHGEPGYYGRGGETGALDLDIYPGRTEVFVDGKPLGKVDAFDGWPRYLWLPKGTYDVVFYLDGYRTIARQITVYPGTVIDIDDRMEEGDSVRPEDLASKTHDRRDDRLRYERERRERLDHGEPGDDESWRDRVRRERIIVRDDRDDDDDDDDDDDEEEIEMRSDDRGDRGGRSDRDMREDGGMGDRGRLRLQVEPEDASVYLDGKFVGTGTDLELLRGGLPVSEGEHTLSVVRPGRRSEEREFRIKVGQEIKIEVELDRTGSDR